MSNQLTVRIRPAIEADAPFIFSSWLKSFRDHGLARPISQEVYYSEQHKLIERLLKTAKAFIACDPKDPASIYGWACFEHVEGIFTVHYIYVKHPFRNLGIGRELLNQSGHDLQTAGLFTHWTPMGLKLHEKFNLLYHPYILINYNRGV